MFFFSLLFLSCTPSADKTEKRAKTGAPVPAEQVQQGTPDAKAKSQNKPDSFASPASCSADKLSEECSAWLVENLQAFAEPPSPNDKSRVHPLQKYNIRAEPLSLKQDGPKIFAFEGDLDTAPKMVAALRELVSKSTVQQILESRLREYNGKVVTSYSDCDETSVVPRNGKWYFAPQGDDTGPDLTNPVPFVKNNKGKWVLDMDISFGCWQLPTFWDPKHAAQFQKIDFP